LTALGVDQLFSNAGSEKFIFKSVANSLAGWLHASATGRH